MKNFLCIFALLMSINIFVPLAYYAAYSGLNNPRSSSASDGDMLKTDNRENTFFLYNIAEQNLAEIDHISFLVGSAACEMPALYSDEAIKAQMVACHSYYLYCKQNGVPDDDLNLSFDERYMIKYASKDRLKEYWGLNFDENYEKLLRCAQEVKDSIVTYGGDAALTTYYAVSCGKTQSGKAEWGTALDYLVPVDSAKDAVSDDYLKITSYSAREMYDRFALNFTGLDLDFENPESWIEDINYNQSGYVDTVEVGGVELRGRDFRKYFELPSASFTVFYEDDTFSIATKGYGHGVGMSQFGANELAKDGANYREILQHYFPGTKISTLKS